MLRHLKQQRHLVEENHVLALHHALLVAIESKNSPVVQRLLTDYTYTKIYFMDKTVLTQACEVGATDIARHLLDGSFPVHLINYLPHIEMEADSKLTALEAACKGNHVGCVELLLKYKYTALLNHEYPNFVTDGLSKDGDIFRPLAVALRFGSLECAETLVTHAQKRGVKFDVVTACHDALKYGHFEIFKKLLSLAPQFEATDENQNVTASKTPPSPLSPISPPSSPETPYPEKTRSLPVWEETGSDAAASTPPRLNGLQVDLTSGQRAAVGVALVTAALYGGAEALRHLVGLWAEVNRAAEVEIPQLAEEPEADNVFYDLTGEAPGGTTCVTHMTPRTRAKYAWLFCLIGVSYTSSPAHNKVIRCPRCLLGEAPPNGLMQNCVRG